MGSTTQRFIHQWHDWMIQKALMHRLYASQVGFTIFQQSRGFPTTPRACYRRPWQKMGERLLFCLASKGSPARMMMIAALFCVLIPVFRPRSLLRTLFAPLSCATRGRKGPIEFPREVEAKSGLRSWMPLRYFIHCIW